MLVLTVLIVLMLVKNFEINFGKKKRKMEDCQRTNTKMVCVLFQFRYQITIKRKKYKKVISGKTSKKAFIGYIGNSCDSKKKNYLILLLLNIF